MYKIWRRLGHLRSLWLIGLAVGIWFLALPSDAFTPIPPLEEPRAIEREQQRVDEQVQTLRGLIRTGELELETLTRELTRNENQPNSTTFDLAMLRDERAAIDGIHTRLSTIHARERQTHDRVFRIDETLLQGAIADPEKLTLGDVVREEGRVRMEALRTGLEELVQHLEETLALYREIARVRTERLDLIRSRLNLASLDETVGFDRDPRIQLATRLVDQLLDRGLSLRQQAAEIDPLDRAAAAEKAELELGGEALIVRSNLRLLDLEQFRIEARAELVRAAVSDTDMPLRVLQDAGAELDSLERRLGRVRQDVTDEAARLASLDAALARRLASEGEPTDALVKSKDSTRSLAELVALQEDGVSGRFEMLEKLRGQVDESIAEATTRRLQNRSELPMTLSGWNRSVNNLAHSPLFLATSATQWGGRALALGERSPVSIAITFGAVIVAALSALFLWKRLPQQWRNGRSNLFGAIGWLLPLSLAWLVLAYWLAMPLDVIVTGLAIVFVAPALLILAWRLPVGAGNRRVSRTILLLSAMVGILWLLLSPSPISPSTKAIVDRLGLLALLAPACLAIRETMRHHPHDRAHGIRLPLLGRVPDDATEFGIQFVATLVIGFCLIGLVGYAALAGYLLLRLAGACAIIALAAAALSGIEQLRLRAVAVVRRRKPTTAAYWRYNLVQPTAHIATIAVVLASLQGLVLLFNQKVLPTTIVVVAILVVSLPFVLRLVDALVTQLLSQDRERPAVGANAVRVVVTQRLTRGAVFIATSLAIIALIGIDLAALSNPVTIEQTAARGYLDILMIVLLADLFWHLAKAAIDNKEREVAQPTQADDDTARRQARLRTLLPILRNILAIVILVSTVLMALSAIGVEIGPLIAGAGVVGVAVGFGAQTLVRDVISGVFFLLDDAFRVGEYIESGEIRGRVEAFSLRSIKMRHHRGALHTVPFGELGSITNYSRDWVKDKLRFKFEPGTDVILVKRLVKEVAKKMLADPEIAAGMITPPKSQGVQSITESGIEISIKFETKPGEQFLARRTLYQLLMKTFEENDIKIATPTVRVAGDAEPGAAAAREAAERAVAA